MRPAGEGLPGRPAAAPAGWPLPGIHHPDTGEGTSSTEEPVARVAPDGPAIFMDCDLGKKAVVMKAMASIGLPVPAVRWVEDGSAALGAPFLVMERASGKVPADDPPFTAAGWVLELSDQQQRRLCEASLEALAAIHNADWRAAGLHSPTGRR